MRILVLSDSHGMPSRILDAVEAHPEAEALIFLGDGISTRSKVIIIACRM